MCFHRSLRHKLPEQFLLFNGLPPRYGLSAMRVKRFAARSVSASGNSRAFNAFNCLPVNVLLSITTLAINPFSSAITIRHGVIYRLAATRTMGKIDAIAQMPEQCQFKAAQRGFWRTSDPGKRLNAVQVIEKSSEKRVSYSSTRERSSLMYKPL